VGTDTLLRRIDARLVYPHVCTLSISTVYESEYESMLYIHSNRKEYKHIVIIESDLILHEYYIIRGAKVRLQEMKRLRDAHELQKGAGQKEAVWG